MTPRKREKVAWCFLSLDYTAQDYNELWVPISNKSEFQAELRTQLAPWITEEKYHKESEAFGYAIGEWYEKVYGSDALEILFLWMREIYLFHGPDRIPETVWNIVPYRAQDIASEFPGFEWIFELLTKVRHAQEESMATFDNKIIEQSLSAWDSGVLEVQYASQEGLDSKIRVMTTYNIFLEAWEKHCSKLCFEELQHMFKVGKRVAEACQMQDLDVAFPGSWRFELRKLLDIFVYRTG